MPDLAIQSFELPTFAVVGKPLRVPFSISSSLAQDTDATIQLEIPGGTKLSQTIRVPAMAIAKGTFEWRPDKVGEESITIQIQHDPRDRIASNDSKRVAISFRSESLKVLMLESFPRWEYRYTRNALERDPGVEVHCYLLHPDIKELGDGRGYLQSFPQDDALFAYDVVFLGDIGMGPEELTESQCQQLRRLVQSQASGLVFMPGMRGRQSSLLNSPLEELFPVDLETARPRGVGASKPGQFQLTEQGHQSLLTRFESNEKENEQVWRSLPGFYWYASVERARAGSQILATHERDSNRFGRIPSMVPGDGAKVLKTSTIIASGAKLFDGWPTKDPWLQVNRCDCFTLPIALTKVTWLRSKPTSWAAMANPCKTARSPHPWSIPMARWRL
jgi:hypothetical protein